MIKINKERKAPINKKTTEQYRQEIFNLVGDEYILLDDYINCKTKLWMLHSVCGQRFQKSPDHFLRGQRCTHCNNLKKDTDSFKQEVYDLVGDEYTVLGEYVNTDTKILMKHNVCGEEYGIKPIDFIRGNRCAKCAGLKKRTTDSFKQEVYDLVGDEYTVLGEYVNTDTKILMKHNVCGEEFYPKPRDFLKAGTRCPNRIHTRMTHEKFKERVFNLTNGEYSLLSQYEKSDKNVYFKHNICGYKFEMLPYNFSSGQRCPNCAITGKPSKLETEIVEFIKSIYVNKIKTSIKNILSNRKELDIYIPDKNLAIEFDGLYWHSEKSGKDKNFHLNKTLECEAKDIQLIHIFEDEWINKQDIVKAKLKYILGCSKDLPKIRASKCYITEVSATDKNQFLNENHIQGEDKASIKLGLWYPISDEEDRLVSVITFCKPRKSLGQSSESKYDYELSRFANDIEFQVYGSFDKLFKYFKDNYKWNSIITYADRRWSKGGLYEATGFVLDHVSKPNYWYCKDDYRYHRFVFRKSELKFKFPDLYSESSTEFEIMDKTRYSRIWDCGNLVYIYTK